MALLLLTRHAQASFGAANYDQLSDLGRVQARWLGQYFAERELSFSRVITGTLQRQVDTATEILSQMNGQPDPMTPDPGLNEYDGDPVYKAYAPDIDARQLQRDDYRRYWQTFREAMTAWADDKLTDVPETWDEFGQRMSSALRKACADTKREDTILVVSSGGSICRALADILGTNAAASIEMNLQMRNSAFCEMIASSNGLRMITFNSMPHLDRPDRRESITAA